LLELWAVAYFSKATCEDTNRGGDSRAHGLARGVGENRIDPTRDYDAGKVFRVMNYHARQLIPTRSLLSHAGSEQKQIRTAQIWRLYRHGVRARELAKLFGISTTQIYSSVHLAMRIQRNHEPGGRLWLNKFNQRV
jgi:hypothetical protein